MLDFLRELPLPVIVLLVGGVFVWMVVSTYIRRHK